MHHHNDSDKVTFLKDTEVKTALFLVQDGLLPALYCVSIELQGKKKKEEKEKICL